MIAFVYRCPSTGLKVQGHVADDLIDGDTYDPVTCTACGRVPLVDPKSGKVLEPENPTLQRELSPATSVNYCLPNSHQAVISHGLVTNLRERSSRAVNYVDILKGVFVAATAIFVYISQSSLAR